MNQTKKTVNQTSILQRVAVCSALVLALGSGASASYAEEGQINYVAMGDSSAAGPLIPDQSGGACFRSDKNWPSLLAAELGATLTDVTCSGAKTKDFAGKQFSDTAPQYDALNVDTDLVTVAIGANDLDMGAVVPSCINPFPQPPGVDSGCKNFYVVNGEDTLQNRIEELRPKIGEMIEEIKRRAPNARIVLTGYMTYYQPGGCWPKDPVWSGDADYIQDSFDALMQMLSDQALSHWVEYIDIRTPSADHGVCAPIGQEWVAGTLVTSPTFFYHPTEIGMRGAADAILWGLMSE